MLPRNHPAKDVYVTGTFDDWSKSVELDRKGDHFEKLVELPVADKKIYYKVGTLFQYRVWPDVGMILLIPPTSSITELRSFIALS